MSEEKSAGSWWQTIPGILTATGTIIVALTGLLSTLHQSGLLGANEAKKSPPPIEAAIEPAPTTQLQPVAKMPVAAESASGSDPAIALQQPPQPKSQSARTEAIADAITEGFTADEQKEEFKKRIQQGFYPRKVEGKCEGGSVRFHTEWKILPPGTAFVSLRHLSKEGFQAKNDKFSSTGYSVESVNMYKDCEGVDRYQATWIKR